MRRRRVPGWAAHGMAMLVAAALYFSGSLEFLERGLLDFRFLASERPASGGTVLVEIDAYSLSQIDFWPWPRHHFAGAVDNVRIAGARQIVIDVDFSAQTSEAEDSLLEGALQRAHGDVVLPVFVRQASGTTTNDRIVAALPNYRFKKLVQLASVNVFPAEDGKVRQLEPNVEILGTEYPVLASLLAGRRFQYEDPYLIDYGIDVDSIPRMSFIDVLKGDFDIRFFRGKNVIFGATAPELGDLVPVPVHLALPGSIIHILGYESLVQGRALQRLEEIPAFVVALIASGLLGAFSRGRSMLRVGLMALAMGGGYLALAVATQYAVPVIIDVTPVLAAVVLSYFAFVYCQIDRQSLELLFQSIDIRRKDAMMSDLVENSTVGILSISEDGRILSANRAIADTFGYARDQLVGLGIGGLIVEIFDSSSEVRTYLSAMTAVGNQEMVGRNVHGAQFPVEVSASRLELEDGAVVTAFVTDITERKRQERELEYQATHDDLTGLFNRAKFMKDLTTEIEESPTKRRMIAVFLIDLDRFKEVNDTLGHPVGDQVLQCVAKRIKERIPGHLVFARFGGDEFAILLPDIVDVFEAEDAAELILQEIRTPFEIEEISIEIDASIGAAIYPMHGRNAEELVQRADIAMYVAKRRQAGYDLYSTEIDAHSVRNLTLTGDLRRGIESGELEIAFQPKVDVASRRVIGAEVLARWPRPGHGYVPPDEFIEHAEQTGLINPLTVWALELAVEHMALWRDAGFDLNIAVNLSARVLHNPEIVSTVFDLTDKWGVQPGHLTLEITENALLVNPNQAMKMVRRFEDLGIRISIDDFGTGYSSLAYLKTLAVDELKIDKSFVLSITDDEADRTIVKSVISMGHELGLKVVAEGIETEEALTLLDELGCDIGQGYLFGKPMDAGAFSEWLRSSKWSVRGSAEPKSGQSAA